MNAEDQLVKNSTSWFTMTITDLRPHRNYTFTVLTKAGTVKPGIMRVSDSVSATFTTSEGTPGKVKLLLHCFLN